MPHGVFFHTAAAMGGKIYVTGGTVQGSTVNSVCVYDPQADAWTQLASMSVARRSHASAVVGGKLYVFCGIGAEGDLSTVEIYYPASDSWAQGASLTSARHSMEVVSLRVEAVRNTHSEDRHGIGGEGNLGTVVLARWRSMILL